jgi:hypothetical protein
MSSDELKAAVSNGTWDSCKMHVLFELIRINGELEKMEKKFDRIIWIGITILVGIAVTVLAQIFLKGIAK